MKLTIYDTTLRDGTQGEGMSLSLDDKLKLAKRLDEFGVHYIEGGWPGSNPKDMDFFREVKKLKLGHAVVAAFGSTRRANIKVTQDDNLAKILETKTKAATIFGKTWDFHVREVLKTTLEENLNMIFESVEYLKSKGLEVIYDAEHFFDGYKANPKYALDTLQAASKAGAVYLVLCDTNGGTLPAEVCSIISGIRKKIKTPLGIHCHNDCNLGVANSVAAVEAGALQVQGTINGYGERCGNANLTSVIPVLVLKLGIPVVSAKKLTELTELSRYVTEVCNMPLERNQPFVGKSAFAHKGGVHVNAMVKNARTYEHIDPKLVGNATRFLVSELSGKSNVLLKAKELKLDLNNETPETRKILEKVRELENQGYQFEAAEASFDLLMRRIMGKEKKFFAVQECRIHDEPLADRDVTSHPTVKIQTPDKKTRTTEAQGKGPVDALYNALREVLIQYYSIIQDIHLIDYKVRVINESAGTAAKVRVFITFRDEKDTWTTVGVSENIIEASWQALVEAIEYKLLKGEKI
ncbi:MAG: citramalate synthase [Candidatus Omnitrophica bacterium]|nr:citramalate synthase [Candidatus Omnitrophota bacterium]